MRAKRPRRSRAGKKTVSGIRSRKPLARKGALLGFGPTGRVAMGLRIGLPGACDSGARPRCPLIPHLQHKVLLQLNRVVEQRLKGLKGLKGLQHARQEGLQGGRRGRGGAGCEGVGGCTIACWLTVASTRRFSWS